MRKLRSWWNGAISQIHGRDVPWILAAGMVLTLIVTAIIYLIPPMYIQVTGLPQNVRVELPRYTYIYLYLLPVLVLTLRWGAVGGMTGTTLAWLAADYFFLNEDDHRLEPGNWPPEAFFLVVLFFSTLIVVGNILARERQVKQSAQDLARRLQEADQRKDLYFAFISHELRSPLTAIMGYSDVLRRRLNGTAETTTLRGLETISAQSRRLEEMVNDLVEVSRMESGSFSIERHSLDLASLVRQVVHRTGITTKQHQFIVEAEEPVIVHGDADRLDQVLTNLIHNAVKYSPEGGHVEVSVTCRDSLAVITVHDEGIGIPPDEQRFLFTVPFKRASNAVRSGLKGLGLGLYICQRIVEQHEGAIRVESQPGQGTTFIVELPLDLASMESLPISSVA